jgi:dephospho-CoA kinase
MTAGRKKIPLVGLLGGIGSGKSTVARLFEKLGCAAIDADAVAHEVLETPDVRTALASRFGKTVFAPDGKVDRKAVAQIVFNNPQDLAFLTDLIHPRALQRVQDTITAIRRQGQAKAIILDAPLLVEAGWHGKCDILVFVECDTNNRLARLHLRAGLDKQQLEAREKFQISLDRKARLAYHTINNNTDFSALESQVGCVFSKITGVE